MGPSFSATCDRVVVGQRWKHLVWDELMLALDGLLSPLGNILTNESAGKLYAVQAVFSRRINLK